LTVAFGEWQGQNNNPPGSMSLVASTYRPLASSIPTCTPSCQLIDKYHPVFDGYLISLLGRRAVPV